MNDKLMDYLNFSFQLRSLLMTKKILTNEEHRNSAYCYQVLIKFNNLTLSRSTPAKVLLKILMFSLIQSI